MEKLDEKKDIKYWAEIMAEEYRRSSVYERKYAFPNAAKIESENGWERGSIYRYAVEHNLIPKQLTDEELELKERIEEFIAKLRNRISDFVSPSLITPLLPPEIRNETKWRRLDRMQGKKPTKRRF